MARIRSDKPEAYQSETLAEISLAAERTFKGMATIADDRGRLADKPAQINGELWSMRGNHTKDDLEAELAEMVKVDLVCRYTGCDGKRYLHMVRWDAHQKIDRPSKSRLPRCPHHQAAPDYCGLHQGDCPFPEGSHDLRDDSRQSREPSRDLEQVQTGHREGSRDAGEPEQGGVPAGTVVPAASNGQRPPEQGKPKSSRQSREPSMQDLGSRTVDRGSRNVKDPEDPPDLGAHTPAPEVPETANQRANRLAKIYTDQVPVTNFPAVAKIVRKAVDADVDDERIAAGLNKVIAENRSLTTETLRVAIYGPPKARGGHQHYRNPEDQSVYDLGFSDE